MRNIWKQINYPEQDKIISQNDDVGRPQDYI